MEERWFDMPYGPPILIRGTRELLDGVRIHPLGPASHAPRCSPSNPCAVRNPAHVFLYGECYVEWPVGVPGGFTVCRNDDLPTPWTTYPTDGDLLTFSDISDAGPVFPARRSVSRPTLAGWVLGIVLFVHYRRWMRARRRP